ncbi:MAG TPA: acyl-ACP desaturase [Acidimicrobiales bacterium]|nr:acyl-ACP desaturase [Acidimicrobiales bacterium]
MNQRFGAPALREALEEHAGRLLARHLAHSKEWFPHELVPWELGVRHAPGQPFDQVGAPLPPGVASALFVNLLTEDNLPGYYHTIAEAFGNDSALGEWSRRWAAEEQRHSIVLRDWVSITRKLDLTALERARMHYVSTGFSAGSRGQSLTDGIVYLTLQELATRISHWNTGRFLDDEGAAVMRRVAADENLHFLFYRDLASAALSADPSGTVKAIARQVKSFQMPGADILGFASHAVSIAAAGIYNFQVHHDQVLAPVVMTHWRLESLEGLDVEAERARESLLAWMARLRRVAGRISAQTSATAPLETAMRACPDAGPRQGMSLQLRRLTMTATEDGRVP